MKWLNISGGKDYRIIVGDTEEWMHDLDSPLCPCDPGLVGGLERGIALAHTALTFCGTEIREAVEELAR